MVGATHGHYRVVKLLGKGGMGDVYLAEDTTLSRLVALKTLSSELSNDPDRRERFQREARAAAALNHPNIVTIHSVEIDGDVAFFTRAPRRDLDRVAGEFTPDHWVPMTQTPAAVACDQLFASAPALDSR